MLLFPIPREIEKLVEKWNGSPTLALQGNATLLYIPLYYILYIHIVWKYYVEMVGTLKLL